MESVTVSSQGHFHIDVHQAPDRVVLRLHGELDLAGAPALAAQIQKAEANNHAALVLDLEDLSFIDSSGLRVILTAHERAQQRKAEFAVTRGSQQVQRLLTTAGVGDYLNTVDSADETLR